MNGLFHWLGLNPRHTSGTQQLIMPKGKTCLSECWRVLHFSFDSLKKLWRWWNLHNISIYPFAQKKYLGT